MSPDISQLDLTKYEQRLVTFMDQWELSFITPMQMAKAGFYYTGNDDSVKCLFCPKTFGCWSRDDDPLEEHKRISPKCKFFSQEEDRGIDECGIHVSSDLNNQENTTTTDDFIDPVSVEQQIKDPRFKEFSSFETRLKSFHECATNLKKFIIYFCEAGLFFTANSQNYWLICFCCGQSFKDCVSDDNLWIKHAQLSPTCSYVLLKKGKNFVVEALKLCSVKNVQQNNQGVTPSSVDEPLLLPSKNLVKHEKNVLQANGCTIFLNTSYVITESSSGIYNQSSISSESPTWDSIAYEHRLRTFNGNWNIDFITPSQMAKAGLYYFGKEGCVKCSFCSTEFGSWQRGDDPLEDHKSVSPECRFFKKEEDQGYDVCGLYMTPIEFNDESYKIEKFLDSIGVVHQIQSPKSKEYSSFDSRLNSFDNCKINLKQDIRALSEAGLFYIGNGQNDKMLCFYCNVIIIDWEEDDEPWSEHAKWSPSCSYILLNKGKNFVDEVCSSMRNEVPNMNHEKLPKLISNDKDYSIIENNVTIDSIKSKLDHLEMTENNQIKALAKENLSPSQQNPNTIPDSMLCIICRDEALNVAFIPCSHVTCIQCAMKLDHCGVCRHSYNKAMRVYVHLDNQKNNDLDLVPCSSSQCSDEPLDSMLCNACHNKEMEAVFLPCRHIYACIKCANDMDNCPVCSEAICATMQVYL